MSGNKIIEKINVVSFDVNCVSGTISRDESADANIFTSGSVRYMDPKHLRAFTSVRQAANRACRVKGVRFLSGWAVPDESVENLVIELNEISGKVVNEKSVLIGNWNDNIQRWIDANPLAANYQSRFPSKEYADKQINASLAVYRINPATVNSTAEDGIQTEVKGLAGRVLNEIAQDVLDTWKPGATQASQRIKGLLNRLFSKCRTLEFLGGNLSAVAKFIDQGVEALPTQGPITGVDFMVLSGLLAILSSPEKMMGLSSDVSDIRQELFILTNNDDALADKITQMSESQSVEVIPVDVISTMTDPVVVADVLADAAAVADESPAEPPVSQRIKRIKFFFDGLPDDAKPKAEEVKAPEETPVSIDGDAWGW